MCGFKNLTERCVVGSELYSFGPYLNGEQHRQKLPLVSNQHGVTNQWQNLLHRILNRNRGNVLSSRGDDQL